MYKLQYLLFLSCIFSGGQLGFAATSDDSEQSMPMSNGMFSASVGLGYDSNIYLAPSNSYIDYAPATPVPESPVVYSGAFVPLKLDAIYNNNWSVNNKFIASYQYDGRLHVERKYGNADTHSHRVELGDRVSLSSNKDVSNELYVGLYLAHKRRLYLDRDTGDEQEYLSTGIDISQKYIYDMYGVALEYKYKGKKVDVTISHLQDTRDYRDPASDGSVAANSKEYDLSYQKTGGEIEFKLGTNDKLSLGYDTYGYDYDQRRARDADGRLKDANPTREYDYDAMSFTLRHRFNSQWLAYIDFQKKDRKDLYLGYSDYRKDLYKIRVHYKINKDHKLKFSYATWERTYPNAFPFDRDWNNANEHTWYKGVVYKISSINKLSKNKSLKLEFKYEDEDTNDLRYDYDRFQGLVSMEVAY